MQERLRPWLGRLNSAQTANIADWATGLGEQNRLWLENRLLWQRQLRRVVAARESADFAPKMMRLLQQREAFYSEEYRASYGRSRQALATLFSQVLSEADESQRERLGHRLRDLRNDLSELQCGA
jgi:hypothetical protein